MRGGGKTPSNLKIQKQSEQNIIKDIKSIINLFKLKTKNE